jgi:transcriptional regulator with XRE-family HTH domain
LGATIRQYRQQCGLSQRALAVKTHLDKSYINQIEKGRRNVSVLSLLRIADALQLPVSRLLAPLEKGYEPNASLKE